MSLDEDDGSVVQLVTSTSLTPLVDGQNGLTMLEGGSLLGSRESPNGTQIFHVPEPPTESMDIEVDILGNVPDNVRVEALYTDCQGLVYLMDSGHVYEFNYNTGTGGTWGVHALGGPLFVDDTARLYLLNSDAELFEADPVDLSLSPILVTGPTPAGDAAPGWSGLAGPLTECESTLPDPQ